MRYKFESGPRSNAETAYLHGSLAATVRYNDEREPHIGQTIELADEHGVFGKATVVSTSTVPVADVMDVIYACNAMYSHNTWTSVMSALNGYYDDPIGPETQVRVLIFEPAEMVR